MKPVTTLLLGLLAGCLLLQGCGVTGEPLTGQQMVFAGTWENEEGADAQVYLSITPGGQVDYQRQEGNDKFSINAPIQKWEDGDFIVGALGIVTRFDVQQPPTKEGDTWVMVVDGRRLVKFSE